jgi:hypothetical protein
MPARRQNRVAAWLDIDDTVYYHRPALKLPT